MTGTIVRAAGGVVWRRGKGGAVGPGHEVDDARWMPLAEARAALTYERDRRILDGFHP